MSIAEMNTRRKDKRFVTAAMSDFQIGREFFQAGYSLLDCATERVQAGWLAAEQDAIAKGSEWDWSDAALERDAQLDPYGFDDYGPTKNSRHIYE